MNLIYQWCQGNLDIILLIYGLAFVIMGVAILVQPRKESAFKLADSLWLFVAYAFIHAPADFLDMFSITRGGSKTFFVTSQILTYTSYIFLFEFGRRLLGLTKKLLSGWILPIIVVCVMIKSILSPDFWTTANILIGYSIRFPAGVMSGLGLILYYNSQEEILKPLKVKKYFYVIAASLLAWSFFCGIVRAKGAFFPSNWLNANSFCLVTGVPVQLFRALCAIIATWAVVGVLNIFICERTERLKKEVAERKHAEEELRVAYNKLEQTQAQLVQSEKLAAIGRLAAGVAHEINNPLFVIAGETEILLNDEHKDKETKEVSKAILEQTERIKKIVSSLLEFSRQKEFKRKPLEINKVLDETIPLLIYQTKMEKIELVKEFDRGLIKILGDKDQLQGVFLNIMLNAVQAMKNGGRLTIKTYSEKITEHGQRATDKFKLDDGIAVIEIKDTGKGMDEQTLSKVFDPFFTTKEKGMGLGLFVSYGIIENHRGIIEAYSKLGEGSTFVVKLPILKGEDKENEEDFSGRR